MSCTMPMKMYQKGPRNGAPVTNRCLLPLLILIALIVFCGLCAAQTNAAPPTSSLAPTPVMGWNSWNKFGCDVNEKLIREIADAMVSTGMQAAGYQYVNVDDCWQLSRQTDGTFVADPQRFPVGIKSLADYVQSRGWKFRLSSDAARLTGTRR